MTVRAFKMAVALANAVGVFYAASTAVQHVAALMLGGR
jgi:hypothetical protein